MSGEGSSSDVNFRSASYWVARTVGMCQCCGEPTALIAVALPPGHETLEIDWEASPRESAGAAPGEADAAAPGESGAEVWQRCDRNAFLFYIEYLPDSVQRRLRLLCRAFRSTYCAEKIACYWANHCEKCGSPLDDHDLFCEPEGAFAPTGSASAASIEIVRIDEEIEAAALGYACDPEFFESMTRA